MKTLLCLFIATVVFGCVPKNDITLNVGSVSTPQTNSTSTQSGCTDQLADNFDAIATTDDSSCTYSPPQATLGNTPSNISSSTSSITNFTVLFANSLDSGEYQYKIIDPSSHNCTDPSGYSNFISTSIAITDDVSSFSSQVQPNTKLCLIARSSNLKNPTRTQSIPTEYTWNTDLTVTSVFGCTSVSATNYNPSANIDDGSCSYYVSLIYGCTDSQATNYNSSATANDGTCTYPVYGCTDSQAMNFNSSATANDGSCSYRIYGCMDSNASNYNPNATDSTSSICTYTTYGCTNSSANNYNPNANTDDGSCVYIGNFVYGCTSSTAMNYNSTANYDDGSCVFYPHASISSAPSAINYDNQSSPPMVTFSFTGTPQSYRYKTYTHSVPSCDSSDPSLEQVVDIGGQTTFELFFPNFDAGNFNATEQNSRVCIAACYSSNGNDCESWSNGATATWISDFQKPTATIGGWGSPGNSTFGATISSSSDTSYYLYKVVPHYYSTDGVTECQDSNGYLEYHGSDLSHIDGDLNSFSGLQNNDVRLCVRAVDYAGNIQDLSNVAYSETWYYSYVDPCFGSNYSNPGCPGYVPPPQAQIANAPSVLNISTSSSMEAITITSNSSDSHYYRYKVFNSNTYTSCSDPMNYSSYPISLSIPIYWTDLQLASIGSNSSSPNNTICVVVDDSVGNTIYENPVSASWLADFQAPAISGMEVDSSSIPSPLSSWSFNLVTNPQLEMNVSHYKYKLIANDGMSSCSDLSGYIGTTPNNSSGFNVSLDSFGMSTGDVLMCILAVDYAGNTQSTDSPYSTLINFIAPDSSSSGSSGSSFSAGDGSVANPYEIWTAADLELVRSSSESSYKLMADIDLSGFSFSPLFETSGFSGIFDGNNHTILNWTYINIEKENVGFFSKLNMGATIKDLTLSSANAVGKNYVGILLGTNDEGIIQNCHVINGSVQAPISGADGYNVGGLVGNSTGGSISNSSSHANVTSRYVVGGLVGSAIGTNITTSHSSGNISAYASYVGGLVGWFSSLNSTSIANSYSTATVDSHNEGGCHGGFVGYLHKNSGSIAPVQNSYSAGSLLASGGGFAGCVVNPNQLPGNAVENSFSVSSVQSSASGFANSVDSGVSFLHVYFDMTSSGQNYCYPGDSGGSCTGINNDPSYFYLNVSMYEPTLYWDFGSIWQSDNINLPTLRNNP